MLTPIILGNKITEARKAKNLSQAQLAQQLAISSQAVGKWERGESMPDIVTLNQLAEILGVDLNYFSADFQSTTPATAAPAPAEPVVEQPAEQPAEQPLITPSLPEQPAEQPAERPVVTPEKRPGWNLSQGNWVDADFSGLKNLGPKFSGSNLNKCQFIGSELMGLHLKSNFINTCNFSKSNFSGSHYESSYLSNSSFRGCSLNEAEWVKTFITTCDFAAADFTRGVFKHSFFDKNCNLSEANFTGATFRNGGLQKTILTGATWQRTAFHSTYFGEVVFDGTINGCSFENCDFSKVIFQNATLTDTFFKNKTLKKIRFIDCKADSLTYAFLKSGKADLSGITLLA